MAPVQVDTAFLNQFLAGGGQVVSNNPAPQPAPPALPPDPALLNPTPAAPTPAPADVTSDSSIWDNPRTIGSWAGARTQQLSDWVAQQPTPGGIAPLLIALIVLVWAVVAVNDQGMTRLQLLYYTVMGRTQLRGARQPRDPNDGFSGGGQASGGGGGGGSGFGAGYDGGEGVEVPGSAIPVASMEAVMPTTIFDFSQML